MPIKLIVVLRYANHKVYKLSKSFIDTFNTTVSDMKNTVLRSVRYIVLPSIMGLLITAAVPAVAGAATASTTISSAIGSVISVFTTSGTVNVNVTPTGSGAQTIASDTVTVSTNDSSGYTLTLQDGGASTAMTDAASATIPALTGATPGSPAYETAGTWGWRVDSLASFGAGPTSAVNSAAISASLKFAAIPASGSPYTLANTSTTASNAVTTVWYAVAANTAQATGTYTNSVTYTCTAN